MLDYEAQVNPPAEEKNGAASVVGKVFRKRHASREEHIRFVGETEFQHRFLDQEVVHWGDTHPRFVRHNGDFELDWGHGDVILCQFLESRNYFLEFNPQAIYYWELDTDASA